MCQTSEIRRAAGLFLLGCAVLLLVLAAGFAFRWNFTGYPLHPVAHDVI